MRLSNPSSPSKTVNLSLNLFKNNSNNNNSNNNANSAHSLLSSSPDDTSTMHGSDDDDNYQGKFISNTPSFASDASNHSAKSLPALMVGSKASLSLYPDTTNGSSSLLSATTSSKIKSFPSNLTSATSASSSHQGSKLPLTTFSVAHGIIDNILGEQDFYREYEEGEVIGQGADSYVIKIRNKNSNELLACKIVPKLSGNVNVKNLQQEIRVLTSIRHPNIISLRQVYETHHELRLVMDLATGGELFDRIVKKEKYSEFEACEVMIGILSATMFLHERNIIHRDIKPENILLATEDNDTFVKLTDFGIAKILQSDINEEGSPRAMDIDPPSASGSKFFSSSSTSSKSRMRTFTAVGSDYYVAPEILRGDGYDKQVDMWSIGVVMYILLCGFPPFHDHEGMNFYTNILNAKFDFPPPYWDGVTDAAKDLIIRMLTVDPEKRIKANEALNHPWILSRGSLATNNPLSPQRYTMFQKFNSTRKLEASFGS